MHDARPWRSRTPPSGQRVRRNAPVGKAAAHKDRRAGPGPIDTWPLRHAPVPIESSLFSRRAWLRPARKGHVKPMNKTLTLLALAALALTVTPTASACQYLGPAAETVNWA